MQLMLNLMLGHHHVGLSEQLTHSSMHETLCLVHEYHVQELQCPYKCCNLTALSLGPCFHFFWDTHIAAQYTSASCCTSNPFYVKASMTLDSVLALLHQCAVLHHSSLLRGCCKCCAKWCPALQASVPDSHDADLRVLSL